MGLSLLLSSCLSIRQLPEEKEDLKKLAQSYRRFSIRFKDLTRDQIQALLRNPDPDITLLGLSLIEREGQINAYRESLFSLRKRKEAVIREKVREMLLREKKETQAFLYRKLNQVSFSDRREGFEELRFLKMKSARPFLFSFFFSPEDRVRDEAAYSAADLIQKSEDLPVALQRAFFSKRAELRSSAVQTLTYLQDRSYLPWAMKALRDPEEEVWRKALSFLTLFPEESQKELLRILPKSSEELKKRILYFMKGEDIEKILPGLLLLLEEDPKTGEDISSLTEASPVRSVKAICTVLGTSDSPLIQTFLLDRLLSFQKDFLLSGKPASPLPPLEKEPEKTDLRKEEIKKLLESELCVSSLLKIFRITEIPETRKKIETLLSARKEIYPRILEFLSESSGSVRTELISLLVQMKVPFFLNPPGEEAGSPASPDVKKKNVKFPEINYGLFKDAAGLFTEREFQDYLKNFSLPPQLKDELILLQTLKVREKKLRNLEAQKNPYFRWFRDQEEKIRQIQEEDSGETGGKSEADLNEFSLLIDRFHRSPQSSAPYQKKGRSLVKQYLKEREQFLLLYRKLSPRSQDNERDFFEINPGELSLLNSFASMTGIF